MLGRDDVIAEILGVASRSDDLLDEWRRDTDDFIQTQSSRFTTERGYQANLVAVGQTFFGIFSANNKPDMANFPNGVRYQRNANFVTRTLLNVSGTQPVAVSIDPFFFKVT